MPLPTSPPISLSQVINEFGVRGTVVTSPGPGQVDTPGGTQFVIVQIWGGGGGGQGFDPVTGQAGAGGGGGGLSMFQGPWTSGIINYTVGFGGAAGPNQSGPPGDGLVGDSSDCTTSTFSLFAGAGGGGTTSGPGAGGTGNEETGNPGSASPEPSVGGVGGGARTSAKPWYDGTGLSAGRGGDGRTGGGLAGTNGAPGAFRVIFLGGFSGLSRALTSYYRQTSFPGSPILGPTIWVPGIPANVNVATSGNINLLGFEGGRADIVL